MSYQLTLYFDVGEGQYAEDDDRHPAHAVGEDDEEEPHRPLAVVEGERGVGAGVADAGEHARVRHQDHHHSGRPRRRES